MIRDRVRAAIESHINQQEWQILKTIESEDKINILEMVQTLNKNNGGSK